MKKLLIPLAVLLVLIAGRGGQVAALSDCCSVNDYSAGGVFNEGPTVGLGEPIGTAILLGDRLWVLFSGGGLQFTVTSPAGVASTFSLFPGSTNFIPEVGGVIGSFQPGYFGDATVNEVSSFDPATGEPAGKVGAVQSINSEGRVTGQALNGPLVKFAENPFDQFLNDNLHGPGVNGQGTFGTIEASGAPCDIDDAQDPCTTYLSWMVTQNPCHQPQWCGGRVIYRDVSDVIHPGPWYTFATTLGVPNRGIVSTPFYLAEGHTWNFRMQDNGGNLIAQLTVGYGSYGDLSANSDSTLISAAAKPQVTSSQVWINCTNWGNSNWFLWAALSNPDGWSGGAGWMPAAPNYCTVNLYDITPGIYGGSRLMRTRRFQYHSTGFAPVQAPSTSPPPDLAARKGKKPADNNWKPQSVSSPKYTGPVN